MATSVGDSSDNPQGIKDLWVGDQSDDPRHAVHAWVGDGADNPRQVDKPTRLLVQDASFCDTSGTFDVPVLQIELNWDNLHFGNVDHVEVWVNDGSGYQEHTTIPVGSSGSRQTETVDLALGEYDVKVRYDFPTDTHSEFSNEDSVVVEGPCA